VETAVQVALEIALAPERLDEGSPEERAAFGLFTIRTPEVSLTEGLDYYVKGYRPGPLVSGYHVAEWFVWNWWRLRWEPRSRARDWALAHCLPSIGEGYVWPNITVFSDGVRTALISEPSIRPDAKPFRFVGAPPVVVPSTVWEGAIDAYLAQVLDRLSAEGLPETNLHRLWMDLLAERGDPALAEQRCLEALLGRDPDTVDDDVIHGLLADSARLGRKAVCEIAANSACFGVPGQAPLTAAEFEELALGSGHEASPQSAVRLGPGTPLPSGPDLPAWRVGVAAAKALRAQERLGADPVDDTALARLAGVSDAALSMQATGSPALSFELKTHPTASRLVLRSKWHTGRRFDLARLIGDRLIGNHEALHPATRAYTYRQKAQRAFAAELLSPFEAVDGMLADDYDDEEHRQEVAEHFSVSLKTIETLLMNHGRLERDYPDEGLIDAAV